MLISYAYIEGKKHLIRRAWMAFWIAIASPEKMANSLK